MKYCLYLLLMTVALISCTQTFKDKINAFEKENYSPKSDAQNELKLGQTIYFETAITEGIDRSRYPAPVYNKEIDKSFFEFVKEEEINDGADGGRTYTFNIYKAVKKGSTQIIETSYTPLPLARDHNDTTKLKVPDTTKTVYNFSIQ